MVKKVPPLVGVTEAAKILGVAKSHVRRFVERGRMPEPVQVLASGPLWVRADVVRVAAKLNRERAARDAKRGVRS